MATNLLSLRRMLASSTLSPGISRVAFTKPRPPVYRSADPRRGLAYATSSSPVAADSPWHIAANSPWHMAAGMIDEKCGPTAVSIYTSYFSDLQKPSFEDGLGSGVVLEGGLVATCAHVMGDENVVETDRVIGGQKFVKGDIVITLAQGGSGAALFDLRGSVIGINSFGRIGNFWLRYGVPYDRIQKTLEFVSSKSESIVAYQVAEVIRSPRPKAELAFLEGICPKPVRETYGEID